MRISLYQPDIAQNVGSMMRLAACMDVPLDIIEPCGFPFDMRRIKQSGLDYAAQVKLHRHRSWQQFLHYKKEQHPNARLILLTTKSSVHYHRVTYQANDIFITGRESAGVPEEVAECADVHVRIPIIATTRSLNVVQAATIVLSEALRQTGGFPENDITSH